MASSKRDLHMTYLKYLKYLQSVNKRGAERTVTADKFVLAMGGRPNYPDVPGASDFAITRLLTLFLLYIE